MPPRGVNESCHPFTAPQLASVVTVAKSAEPAIPKRTSLPSMFPPGCVALALWFTPCRSGFPRDSAQYAVTVPAVNRHNIAAQTAPPCRCEPVMRPSKYVSADGIAKIRNISKEFVSGVGFSDGWALLALKNPPP